MYAHSEYFGQYTPTDKDRIKHELVKRYHEKTEAYDRSVCNGPIINGSIMPLTAYESKLISKYAFNLRTQLIKEAEQEGISPKELRSAISHYQG